MRAVTRDDLGALCRGITHSFVHLETRDAYGTEVELTHWAKWLRGEPDDFGWLDWWLEMVRGHRAAGRTCRRLRVVSEPLSDYQRWVLSFTGMFVDAGEDIRYVPRPRLVGLALPGSGDFYVFDKQVALFLHYAGSGINASFEVSEDPDTVESCAQSFEAAWNLATPFRDYRPA
jgi:hypothetical protein